MRSRRPQAINILFLLKYTNTPDPIRTRLRDSPVISSLQAGFVPATAFTFRWHFPAVIDFTTWLRDLFAQARLRDR
jgi:hypothetical protein